MSKSGYEEYADKKQPELLKSTATLADAISILQGFKKTFSDQFYEAACDTVAALFNLSFDEIDRAVSGVEYWVT